MNIKRILPMEINLRLRNAKDFLLQKKYYIPEKKEKEVRCFYLDAATYNNLGDQAIALSMEIFLDDLFGQDNVFVINETEVISYLRSLKKEIKKDDVIALSGGGNMGDLYPRYESIRRLIIKNFPDNKIVIFPQTLDYSKDKYGTKELAEAQKIYSRHDKLWVCAREKRSYEKMKLIFPKVLLIPDIVFYLYGKIPDTDGYRTGVGLCLRTDKESILSENEKAKIYKAVMSNKQCGALSTMEDNYSYYNTVQERWKVVERKLKEFSEKELIITDRLHGMIFSILMNVPCIAFDNSNHKVSGVYNLVSQHVRNVIVIDREQINGIEKLLDFHGPKRNSMSFDAKILYNDLICILKCQ